MGKELPRELEELLTLRAIEKETTPQRKFIRETHSRMSQRERYGSVFNGHYFSCNEYGHRALYCRHHVRKHVGRFNNNVRCLK
jgi:hypothetical protein